MRARFTPEARGAILQNLYAGLTLAESAERAGLPPQTLRNWLTRGRGEAGTEHAAFVTAVDEARDVAAAAPMSSAEFRGCLNRAVRRGSVAALKLWWAIHADEAAGGAVDAEDPFAARDAARSDFTHHHLHHDDV